MSLALCKGGLSDMQKVAYGQPVLSALADMSRNKLLRVYLHLFCLPNDLVTSGFSPLLDTMDFMDPFINKGRAYNDLLRLLCSLSHI